jgi:putative holliday junction resolvase
MMMERLLGVDIGERRIGVALSDELGMIASPIATIDAQGDVAGEFRKLVSKYGVARLIVGLPIGLSGREGPQSKQVRSIADDLGRELGIEIVYSDERLSSAVANQALISQGTRRARRKEQVDAMAAAVILQGYLDSQRWKLAK